MIHCSFKSVIMINRLNERDNKEFYLLYKKTIDSLEDFIYNNKDNLNVLELAKCFKYLMMDFLYTSVNKELSDIIRLKEIILSLKKYDDYTTLLNHIRIDEKIIDKYLDSLVSRTQFDENTDIYKALILERIFDFINQDLVKLICINNYMVLFALTFSLLFIDEDTKIRLINKEITGSSITSIHFNSNINQMNRTVYINKFETHHNKLFIKRMSDVIKKINFLGYDTSTKSIIDFYLSIFISISLYILMPIEDFSSIKRNINI